MNSRVRLVPDEEVYQAAVRALMEAGFRIARQIGHIVMVKGSRIVVIPRANPINPVTTAAIVPDAGLVLDEFRDLLK